MDKQYHEYKKEALRLFTAMVWRDRTDVKFELSDDGNTVFVTEPITGKLLRSVNINGDNIIAMIYDIYRQAGEYLM